MDVDSDGAGGDCGGGDGADHDCATTSGGGASGDDFAASDGGIYVAEHRKIVPEVEKVVATDVGVLPDVFATVWSVVAGGLCDYCERNGRIWGAAGDGGANLSAVFLVEDDEDVGDVPWGYQYADADVGGGAVGEKSGVGEFASR